MAIKSVTNLKTFFTTGSKPTQQQFWDWLDSFLHKQDGITIANVTGLQQQLNQKADLLGGLVRQEQLPQTPVGNNNIVLTNTNSYNVPAGTLLQYITVIDEQTITFSVGTTIGAKNYIEDVVIIEGEEIINAPKYFKQPTTLYFNGINSTTIIRLSLA